MADIKTLSVRRSDLPHDLVLILFALGAAGLCVLLAVALPPACDWQRFYVPATRALWRGESPYDPRYGFFNPPWVLLLLTPFAVHEAVGRAALFVLALATIAAVVRRLGGTLLTALLVLASPPMLNLLWDGNIDWLALGGLLLPPRWGLFLVTIKPQVGLGIALWWAVEAWREEGWKGVWDLAWPVALAFLGSLALFGPWPLRSTDPVLRLWNTSLWPWSAPVGLALLGWGIRARNLRPALAAAPLLSPHVILHSWITALVALARRPVVLAVLVVALWVIALSL
jgi:hypothetical protein